MRHGKARDMLCHMACCTLFYRSRISARESSHGRAASWSACLRYSNLLECFLTSATFNYQNYVFGVRR